MWFYKNKKKPLTHGRQYFLFCQIKKLHMDLIKTKKGSTISIVCGPIFNDSLLSTKFWPHFFFLFSRWLWWFMNESTWVLWVYLSNSGLLWWRIAGTVTTLHNVYPAHSNIYKVHCVCYCFCTQLDKDHACCEAGISVARVWSHSPLTNHFDGNSLVCLHSEQLSWISYQLIFQACMHVVL